MIEAVRVLICQRLEDIEKEIKSLEKEYKDLVNEVCPVEEPLKEMKMCLFCNTLKPIYSFYRLKGNKCKSCCNESRKKYPRTPKPKKVVTKANESLDEMSVESAKKRKTYGQLQQEETLRLMKEGRI